MPAHLKTNLILDSRTSLVSNTCSKHRTNVLEQRQLTLVCVFAVNFEQILQIILVFHNWLYTSKCRLGYIVDFEHEFLIYWVPTREITNYKQGLHSTESSFRQNDWSNFEKKLKWSLVACNLLKVRLFHVFFHVF